MRALVTGVYPTTTLRRIPAFLSSAPHLTLEFFSLLIHSTAQVIWVNQFVLLIRFSLIETECFASLTRLWFRLFRVGSAD